MNLTFSAQITHDNASFVIPEKVKPPRYPVSQPEEKKIRLLSILPFFNKDGEDSEDTEEENTAREFANAFQNKQYGLIHFNGVLKIFECNTNMTDKHEIGEVVISAYNLTKLMFDYEYDSWENTGEDSYLLEAMTAIGDYDGLTVLSHGYETMIDKLDESIHDRTESEPDGYLVVIDKLYINANARNKGYGTFIIKNLFKLLYAYFHIETIFVTGVCNVSSEEAYRTKTILTELLRKHDYHVFDLDNYPVFCSCIFESDFLNDISELMDEEAQSKEDG